jgi:hypothetical protein
MNELNNGDNLFSQYWEGSCPCCSEKVKIYAPPDFIDYKSALNELEARYKALKEYVYEYSKWLEKQVGYYPEDQYLKECLTEMLERLTNFYPFMNFDNFRKNDDEKRR